MQLLPPLPSAKLTKPEACNPAGAPSSTQHRAAMYKNTSLLNHHGQFTGKMFDGHCNVSDNQVPPAQPQQQSHCKPVGISYLCRIQAAMLRPAYSTCSCICYICTQSLSTHADNSSSLINTLAAWLSPASSPCIPISNFHSSQPSSGHGVKALHMEPQWHCLAAVSSLSTYKHCIRKFQSRCAGTRHCMPTQLGSISSLVRPPSQACCTVSTVTSG